MTRRPEREYLSKKDRLIGFVVVPAVKAESDIVHITTILTYICLTQRCTQRTLRSGSYMAAGWLSGPDGNLFRKS